MNYYIQGCAAKADKIKAAFEKLGVASNANRYNYKNDYVLYFSAGGMMHMIDANGSWANIIKTHPDYKELELPIKPKFKVGDWVVFDNRQNSTYRVDSVREYDYMLKHTHGGLMPFPFSSAERLRLWSLADAKDGDVITNGKLIVIFNKLEEPVYRQHIIAYVGLDLCGRLQITEDTWRLGVDKAMPATKEQRDLLFKKMKEAGYQWDSDNKELHKIQPHYDIKNFKPFDKVLIRVGNNSKWTCDFFSYYHNGCFHCVGTDDWSQCIPFEGNETLVGTTDMCNERFINW